MWITEKIITEVICYMSDSVLETIESNMKTLIESMTVTGGYNYDWGTINHIDEVKQDNYPTAIVRLDSMDNLDATDGSGYAGAYKQNATYEITVKAKNATEQTEPLNDLHKYQYRAFEDLLKLFGTNYCLYVGGTPACHYIKFESVEGREVSETGDIFRGSDLVTKWQVFFEQSRKNPNILL